MMLPLGVPMPRATENRHHAHDAAPDRRPDGASYPTRVRAPPSFLSVSWSDRCQVTMSQEQRNNDDKPDDTEDDTHTVAEGDGEPEDHLGDEDAVRAAESDAAFAARLPPRTTATNGDDHSTRAAPERTRDESHPSLARYFRAARAPTSAGPRTASSKDDKIVSQRSSRQPARTSRSWTHGLARSTVNVSC
jgi:hypothetical protein